MLQRLAVFLTRAPSSSLPTTRLAHLYFASLVPSTPCSLPLNLSSESGALAVEHSSAGKTGLGVFWIPLLSSHLCGKSVYLSWMPQPMTVMVLASVASVA